MMSKHQNDTKDTSNENRDNERVRRTGRVARSSSRCRPFFLWVNILNPETSLPNNGRQTTNQNEPSPSPVSQTMTGNSYYYMLTTHCSTSAHWLWPARMNMNEPHKLFFKHAVMRRPRLNHLSAARMRRSSSAMPLVAFDALRLLYWWGGLHQR